MKKNGICILEGSADNNVVTICDGGDVRTNATQGVLGGEEGPFLILFPKCPSDSLYSHSYGVAFSSYCNSLLTDLHISKIPSPIRLPCWVRAIFLNSTSDDVILCLLSKTCQCSLCP